MFRRLRNRILRALAILSFAVLPGSFIKCDLDDGEFKIDFDEIGVDFDDGDFVFDFWYLPPFGCCHH